MEAVALRMADVKPDANKHLMTRGRKCINMQAINLIDVTRTTMYWPEQATSNS
jgi:hypothetical protein